MRCRLLSKLFVVLVLVPSPASHLLAQFPAKVVNEESQQKLVQVLGMAQLSLLIRNPKSAEHLELTEDQLVGIKGLMISIGHEQTKRAEAGSEFYSKMAELSKEKDQKGMEELQQDYVEAYRLRDEQEAKSHTKRMQKLDEILLPHQSKRLRQLARQHSARLLCIDELVVPLTLAKELGLNQEQRDALFDSIEKERELFEQEIDERRQAAMDRIAASLTPKQGEKLNELIGDLFNPQEKLARESRNRKLRVVEKRRRNGSGT